MGVVSMKMRKTEQNWRASEREVYAIRWSIQKFDYCLRERPIIILVTTGLWFASSKNNLIRAILADRKMNWDSSNSRFLKANRIVLLRFSIDQLAWNHSSSQTILNLLEKSSLSQKLTWKIHTELGIWPPQRIANLYWNGGAIWTKQ